MKDIELKALQLFNQEISSRAKREKITLEFKPEKGEENKKITADEDEIKYIFREIAKKSHPDKLKKQDENIFIDSAKAKKEGKNISINR